MPSRFYLRGQQTIFSGSPLTEQSPERSNSGSVGGSFDASGVRVIFDASFSKNTTQSGLGDSGALYPTIETGSAQLSWFGWWSTPALSATILNGGTFGIYGSVSSNDYVNFIPRFHAFIWRPGFGKVATIVNPQNAILSSSFQTVSQSLAYSTGTLQDGDRILVEWWASSSYTGSSASPLIQGLYYNGVNESYVDGQSHSLSPNPDNYPASWFEFSSDSLSAVPVAITASNVFIKHVIPHPTDPNKLRVKFSDVINTSSLSAGNFFVTSSFIVRHAAIVSGSTGKEADIHFGTDLPVTSSTYALWRFDEATGSVCSDDVLNFPLASTAPVEENGLFNRARKYYFPGAASIVSQLNVTPSQAIAIISASYGNWTADMLFKWYPSAANDKSVLFKFGGTESTTTSPFAKFFVITIKNSTNAGKPNISWNSGNVGSNNLTSMIDSTVDCKPIVPGAWTLLTVRKSLSSGTLGTYNSLYNVDFFMNGRQLNGFRNIQNPSTANPASASMYFAVGRDGGGTNLPFSGTIDTVRFSTSSFTNDEIFDYHQSYNPITRNQTYLLSASSLLDVSGSTLLEPNASMYFDYFKGYIADVTSSQVPHALFVTYNTSSLTSYGRLSSFVTTVSTSSVTPLIRTPPTITNFSPATGSSIYVTTPVGFDITDDGPFRRIIIHALYSASRIDEVVHDGNTYGPKYTGSLNTRTAIAGGYTYVMLRDGGWPESPIITPYAIDITGSENS